MAVEPHSDTTGQSKGRKRTARQRTTASARRKKKTTASPTETTEGAVEAAPAGSDGSQSAKKATRSTRARKITRKKGPTPSRTPEAVEAPADAARPTEATKTPVAQAKKKTRAVRKRKKKVPAPPAEASAERAKELLPVATPVDAPPQPPEEVPDKPKRRRRRSGAKRSARRGEQSDVAAREVAGVAAPPAAPPDAAPEEEAVAARKAVPATPAADDGFGAGLFAPVRVEPAAAPPRREAQPAHPDEPKVPAVEREDDARPAKPPRKSRRRGGRGRSGKSAGHAQADRGKTTDEGQPQAPETESDADEATAPGALEMIINVAAGDECRIAVLENGRLQELFLERQSAESHVNSIYKGRVTNVEPSIGAIFVDFGLPKNGFLHISDVHPQYFPNGGGASEDVGRKIPRRDRPPIQKCFRRGQEVVVQVTKEGIGTKGPSLTSYLSIPGRFLVMMPGMSRLGVSRKIEDEAVRRTMRELLNELDLPEGIGFILRTAGLDRTKRELQRDLNYLSRLWKIIAERIRKVRAPAEVYQESDLVIRTIRDVLTSDFRRVIVDDEATAQKAREFLKIALPRSQDIVHVHNGRQPIFHQFGIEEEIERINARHVPLRSGGSIVIESTEAMVAIDVNSGKFRDVDDAEQSAFQINQEAAEEIARQLRLRDLGGLIVCDFIDMRVEKHKRAVERCLRDALKKHKERARILRTSAFGLIEITRQRQRSSIRRSIYTECPHCRGSGTVKSAESMALEVLRVLQLVSHQAAVKKTSITVSPEVASLVQNQRRARLHELEEETGARIIIRGEPTYALDQLACECEDSRGQSVTPAMQTRS